MYILFLVRVLVRIRMLDHPASRLGLENDPRAVALFQVIGHLHARPLRRAVLRSEFNFGVGLISIDGNISDIHHHGGHIQRANSGEVLHDSGANGIVVILLLFASAGGEKRGQQPQCQGNTLHAKILSRDIETGLPVICVSISLGDAPNIILSKLAVHRKGLQPVAHEQGDADVQNGQNGEGITKRPVDDVPEVENLLRALEEEYAFGERRLSLSNLDGTLQFPV